MGKIRKRDKLKGKILVQAALHDIPKDALPIAVFLKQKQKAGVDIKPIVKTMMTAVEGLK